MTKIKLSARLFGSSLVVLTALSGLSGCAREPTPITQKEARANAVVATLGRECISRGLSNSTPSAAYAIQSMETKLAKRSSPAQIQDTRNYIKTVYGANITGPSDCRAFDLRAMQLYQFKVDSDRQDDLDQLTDSIKQSKPRATPNPTRYANCVTAGGFTNCYAY